MFTHAALLPPNYCIYADPDKQPVDSLFRVKPRRLFLADLLYELGVECGSV